MAIVLDGTTGITTPDLTDTSLTSGRVVYAGTGGNLTGSTALGFDGTNLLVGTTTSLSGQAGRTDVSVNGSSTAIVSLGVGGARQGYLYTPGTGIILASENNSLSLTTTSGQPIVFNTNATERGRFDSSGNFFIAATSVGAGFTGPQLVVGKSANPYGIIEIQGNKSGSDGASGLLMFYNSAGSSRLGVISAERTGADNSGALVFTTFNAGTGGEVGRFNKNGVLSLANASTTATGVGIAFPATQSASSDANTLDDYEEGTWTAGFATDGGGTVTIDTSYRTATYTKVGRIVTVHAQLVVGSVSSPNGILFITGLPFIPLSIGNGSQNRAAFPVSIAGISSGNSGNFIGQVINNNTSLYVYYNNGTIPESSAANKCQTNSGVYFCATYVTST